MSDKLTGSLWTRWWSGVQKDEQWVVTEIAKGWAALQKETKTAETDLLGIFNWISAHQVGITNTFKGVLEGLAVVGAAVPQTAPAVATATIAIDAATAAIDALSKGIQQGSTPLSTAVNAYHAVKQAQTAVNAVLVQATAKP